MVLKVSRWRRIEFLSVPPTMTTLTGSGVFVEKFNFELPKNFLNLTKIRREKIKFVVKMFLKDFDSQAAVWCNSGETIPRHVESFT